MVKLKVSYENPEDLQEILKRLEEFSPVVSRVYHTAGGKYKRVYISVEVA